MSPEIARDVTLREVLEDALVQVENLSTPEDVNYVLARIQAHAQTGLGRLQVASLLGDSEHVLVTTREAMGDERVVEQVIAIADTDLAVSNGETVLVIAQRRWEA